MSDFDTMFAEMGVPVLKQQLGDLITHNPANNPNDAETITAIYVDLDNATRMPLDTPQGHRLELHGVIVIDATISVSLGPISAKNSTFVIDGELWFAENLVGNNANTQTIAVHRFIGGTTQETRE